MKKSSFKKSGKTIKEVKQEARERGRLLHPQIHNKKRQIKKCFICKKPFKSYFEKEIHHIHSLSEGGSNHITNLCIVHKECHKRHHQIKEGEK